MKVAIILSTFNGEKYIKELIESLYLQTMRFDLFIRDDGSTDNTVSILLNLKKKYNFNLEISSNVGINKSYFLLLKKVQNYDFISFCDQDDVWKNIKLEVSVNYLKSFDIPALVYTDVEITDENLNPLFNSFYKYKKLNPLYNELPYLLVDNVIIGNTIVINKKLANLIKMIPEEAIMFDWWIGLIASIFGRNYFLSFNSLYYRQHSNNVIGAKKINLDFDTKKYFIQAEKLFNLYGNVINDPYKEMLVEFINISNKKFLFKNISFLFSKFKKHSFIKHLCLSILL